jgi:non-lysosomal glucosylceramidase
LVDQLVGQFFAHVCGLGYLTKRANVRKTLKSIQKYNHREKLVDHFNCMRSYALGDESALLMASYPKDRPDNPFPYFTEVMTGFEYTAAIGMLYEGQLQNGLRSIQDIRNRYDGQKRSPFDEAECGHHYARAMIAWAGGLALTGFNYSGVTKTIAFASNPGTYFWSNGYAWGTVGIARRKTGYRIVLDVLYGQIRVKHFKLSGVGEHTFGQTLSLRQNRQRVFVMK